jgi:AraC-like DNA-binding protein
MMESFEFWDIPLGQKPEITTIGFGYHGSPTPQRYRIHGLWLLNFYHTPSDLILNGKRFTIDYGSVSVVAPDVDMEYRYHSHGFNDRYVHFELAPGQESLERIAVVQQLGADFKRINAEFEEAASSYQRRPARAEAKVWDILWQLVDRSTIRAETGIHLALQVALDYIEANLDSPINPNSVAERSGLSYPHLARLCQHHCQTTIGSHIRRRRVERAEYLLKFTNIQIKDIAAQVGIPDLHTFNKTVRKELAKSPSEIRRSADGANR